MQVHTCEYEDGAPFMTKILHPCSQPAQHDLQEGSDDPFDPFEQRGNALPDADAHGCDAIAPAGPL